MSVENAEWEKSCAQQWSEAVEAFKVCPPISPFTTIYALVILTVMVYGTLWGLAGEEALPGGPIFGLFVLIIVCFLGGELVRFIKLPILVGMMLVGFILRNVPVINVAKDIPDEWAANIRNTALVLILLRAGLEVEADVLRKNKVNALKLIFIPLIAEFLTGALISRAFFYMPWLWSFLLGAMLSAVSPAVVLPVMLKLHKEGIGTEHGVTTLVIAVAGIDDVLALTSFEVLLGIVFATGDLTWTIAQGPLQMIAGIIYGIVMGVILWYVPNPVEKSTSILRFLLLCFGGASILFGSQRLLWGATGALGCICLPFVAAIRWKQSNWDEENNPVGDALAFVWMIIESALFGLVGSEIRIQYLQPTTVGFALALLFIGMAVRFLAAFLSGFGTGLNVKERVCVAIAGMPKATVQAAIGPMALSMAKKNNLGPDIEDHGIKILTVAVLAILITAPVGATAIALLAPKLLATHSNQLPSQQEREVTYAVRTIIKDAINIHNSSKTYITNQIEQSNTKNDSKTSA